MNTETEAFVTTTLEEHPLVEIFKKVSRKHEHLKACFDLIMRLASRTGTSGVIILTGPTGSGKTHLARKVFAGLSKQFQALVDADESLVPIVGIRAVPPRATAFDWQDFFIRLLEKLRDILAEKKLLVPVQLSMLGDFPVISPAETMRVTALRRCVENALRRRKTRVLIIDEAHHILMCKDPDLQRFIFEQLKSLTDETGIMLVLVGTYDLLDIRDHSGQLMRRTDIVHLQRYDYANSAHINSFSMVFGTLADALPIKLTKKARENKDLFYRKSAGCIGILRDLLVECLRRAIEDGRTAIDEDIVHQCAKSNLALGTVLAEAMDGEDRLQDIDDEEIRQFMLDRGIPKPEEPGSDSTPNPGSEPPAGPPKPPGKGSKPTPDSKLPNAGIGRKRPSNARPGRRKPGRDPVGMTS